jgi:hypothetical protein
MVIGGKRYIIRADKNMCKIQDYLAKVDQWICLHKQIIRSLEKHSAYEQKDHKQCDSHNSLHTDTEHYTPTQPTV